MVSRPAADIVIPVWRPPPERLEAIVRASLAQQDAEVHVALVHDGPDPEYEPKLRAIAGIDPMVRVIIAGRSGSDVTTRAGILGHFRTDAAVFIDDDAVPGPSLVARHLDQLAKSSGVVMGRLQTVIPEPRSDLRPAALLYDRWYQDKRKRWQEDPATVYPGFWAGNFAMHAETFARIDQFMPPPQPYGHDAFYGIIARELGIRVTYRDDIVARHMVQRPLEKIPAIGYSAGSSAAVMARGVEGLLPEKAEEFRGPVNSLSRLPGVKWLERRYARKPARYQKSLLKAIAMSAAHGPDAMTLRLLDVGYALELLRGYNERNRPNAESDEIAKLLMAARSEGKGAHAG